MTSQSVSQITTANQAFANSFDRASLSAPPTEQLAVVTCMDARIDVELAMGLAPGAAHIMRNAGGLVTDDTIRSLSISQHALGTRTIVLVHHTRCGVLGFDEDGFLDQLETSYGDRPQWKPGTFDDPFDDVRKSIERIKECPFIPHTDDVVGFVYDVDTGALLPV